MGIEQLRYVSNSGMVTSRETMAGPGDATDWFYEIDVINVKMFSPIDT